MTVCLCIHAFKTREGKIPYRQGIEQVKLVQRNITKLNINLCAYLRHINNLTPPDLFFQVSFNYYDKNVRNIAR